MENQPVTQIIEEVRQLCEQYIQEVPRRRGSWPRSIKGRILKLLELGLSADAVATQTGVPSPTIYSWKSAYIKPKPFLPVKIIPDVEIVPKAVVPTPAPAVVAREKSPKRRGPARATPTIIVIAPNGMRFEGCDVMAALKIAQTFGKLP